MLVDEYDIVYSLKTVLEETKLFQVDGHTDPILALSIFKPDTYDLVVLDIRIPVMNGFDCIRIYKAIDGMGQGLFPDSRNGFTSEYKIHYTDIIKEIECGKIDCCMDKPVASTQFLNRIRKVIS